MRIVVYSALYGEREPLNPLCMGDGKLNGPGYDRVLFTDRAGVDLPGVEIRQDTLTGLDPARASRRAKLRPQNYFPDHDWTLYIDNNAALTADPHAIVATLGTSAETGGFFALPHPLRRCLYQEAESCLLAGREEPEIIRRQMEVYRMAGYPADAGLTAGMFLLRRGNRPEWALQGERWFEHVLHFARRDQLSCDFTAWSLGLTVERLPGTTTENNFMRWPAFSSIDRRPNRIVAPAPILTRATRAIRRRLGRRLI